MWLRDHRARQQSRWCLLDDCARLLEQPALSHGDDSFPRLCGCRAAHDVDVRLISDTMTIRRLPQLWLQTTVLDRLEGVGGFAVLVRPSGYEFYSLTNEFEHAIETPATFPPEVLIRGKDWRSERLFEKLAPTLVDILSDPLVKEIAVTSRGLRITRQAAEGRRGDYLLLRQAVFDDASVPATTLATVLDQIQTMSNAARSTLDVRSLGAREPA
jgi:hypothetical protein